MQVTGCDFVCDNPTCDGYGCSISLHGIWPIATIEKVMSVESDSDRMSALLSRKAEGRTHACVVMPNTAEVELAGVRIQSYCKECKIVWDEDFIDRGELDLDHGLGAWDRAHAFSDHPDPCQQCDGKTISSRMAIKNPFGCPMCDVPMTPNTWLTKGSEDGDQGSSE